MVSNKLMNRTEVAWVARQCQVELYTLLGNGAEFQLDKWG